AAGLLTVAPDLDFVPAAQLGCDYLPADRRRCLLAPAVVGAERAIDVVVARNPRLEPEVLDEMAAHALAEEFLPAVAVFRHRGIAVGLPERGDCCAGLLFRCVDTSRRGIEIAFDFLVPG